MRMKRARCCGRKALELGSALIALWAAPTIVSAAPPGLDHGSLARSVRAELLRPSDGSERRYASSGPDIVLTPRFLVVYDRELRLNSPPWSAAPTYAEAFELAREAWEQSQPDAARALMVFTAFDAGNRDLFYLHMANDVLGLGEGEPAQIFDDTPDSSLDGYIWMGDPRLLQAAGEAYYREGFIHEIAHRWTAYPRIVHPSLPADALRGRQLSHWSYFLDTQGSPMEGNDWQATESALWMTMFEQPPRLAFSELDLYLMGLIPPEAVSPITVLTNEGVVDPSSYNVSAATTPAHRSNMQVTLNAEPVSITIDQIIAANGPRIPAARPDAGVVEWPIGIVLLSRGRTINPISPEFLADFDRQLEGLLVDFETATGGRMRLMPSVLGAGTRLPGEACATEADCNLARSDSCLVDAAGELSCGRSAPICSQSDCPPEVETAGDGGSLEQTPRVVDPIGARTPSESCRCIDAKSLDRETNSLAILSMMWMAFGVRRRSRAPKKSQP